MSAPAPTNNSVPQRGKRHPMTVVSEARRMAAGGWTKSEIARYFEARGIKVSKTSVGRWVDPAFAARTRKRARDARRRMSAARTGRLGPRHATPEFKLARMAALRDAGLTVNGVAKVMRVDFGDLLDDHQVRYALEVGRYPQRFAREDAA